MSVSPKDLRSYAAKAKQKLAHRKRQTKIALTVPTMNKKDTTPCTQRYPYQYHLDTVHINFLVWHQHCTDRLYAIDSHCLLFNKTFYISLPHINHMLVVCHFESKPNQMPYCTSLFTLWKLAHPDTYCHAGLDT